MERARRVAFIGDVHLDEGDLDLGPFCDRLREVGERCDWVVLMGDLFNLWIGQQALQRPHHQQVIDALRELRQHGVRTGYIEGNRDYRIGPFLEGDAFDRVWEEGVRFELGERHVFAIHGDLANTADRRYRRWRRWSRGGLMWTLFNLLPASGRQRLSSDLERRMRSTNREFKREFPEAVIRDYGAPFLVDRTDTMVLGHFHVERALVLDDRRVIRVLPEWKPTQRHLELSEHETEMRG